MATAFDSKQLILHKLGNENSTWSLVRIAATLASGETFIDALPVVGEFTSSSLEETIENSIAKLEGGYSTMLGKPSGGTFITAYLAATQITCTGLPSLHPTLTDEDIEKIVQIDNTGAVVETYLREDYVMTVAGNVITVTGATFAVTDTLVVYTNVALVASPNYAEDTTHVTGDIGTMLLGVRNDANNALAADGKYSPLTTDSKGNLFVNDAATRVFITNIATAVEIMDDWDEANRAKVNPIVGQAGIAADAGVMDANTTRITIATDDTHFGSVGDASDVDGTIHGQLRYIGDALNDKLNVVGPIADDSAAMADGPVKVGTVAESTNRTVDAGDVTNLRSTLEGLLKIAGYDTTQDILKIVEQSPLWAHRTDPDTSYSAVDITNAFVSQGEIAMDTYNHLTVGFALTIGTSVNVQIKVVGLMTSGGTEYVLDPQEWTLRYSTLSAAGDLREFDTDADGNSAIEINTNNTWKYIKFYVKDDADGTGTYSAEFSKSIHTS